MSGSESRMRRAETVVRELFAMTEQNRPPLSSGDVHFALSRVNVSDRQDDPEGVTDAVTDP